METSSPTLELLSHSPAETRRLGALLGLLLQPGDVICLQGELGAGKTTFVQGLASGWGSLDAVSSPTFVLVNLYRRADGAQLYHFDTYRVDSALEAEELDLESMQAAGTLLIEWPERMLSVLPAEKLWIRLDYPLQADAEDQRLIHFSSTGERYQALLLQLTHAMQETR